MPRNDTVFKVQSFLYFLKEYLQTQEKINLTKSLHEWQIPTDYGKIIVSVGLLKKTTPGKRGPASYVWNEEMTPTVDVATSLIVLYNNKRKRESVLRGDINVSNKKRIEILEGKIDYILKILEQWQTPETPQNASNPTKE